MSRSKRGNVKKAGAASLLLCALMSAPAVSFAERCVTAACHAAISSPRGKHEPVASGECLSCHVREGKEHPAAGAKGFKLSAKGRALCDTCHFGVGTLRFVHAPVKEGDCLSCHKAHGAKGRFLLDAEQDLTPLCFGCHDSAPFKRKVQHGPVAEGACLACHAAHDAAGKSLLKKGVRELCLECHEEFAKGMQAAERIHPPVKEKPCTSCHDPHGGETRFLLKKKMPDLCLDCHGQIARQLKTDKVIHKPVTDGRGCGNCHSAHYAKGRGLLPAGQKEVCLSCHNTDTLGKPPLRNMAKEIAGDKKLHGPLGKGRCDGCHDPHASNHENMLTGSYPGTFYAPYTDKTYGVCLRCHDKNLLTFPDTTIYTKFRNGNRNLHFVHVADRIKGRTCIACHDTHASRGSVLVATDGVAFGKWRVQARFEKSATGGSCSPGCHKGYKYDRDKPVGY